MRPVEWRAAFVCLPNRILLLIRRSQVAPVEVSQILTRGLKFFVALLPRFSQFLPLLKFFRRSRVRKDERLQRCVGARESRLSFVKRFYNVIAS
jgi:hypothetical protein